MMQLECHIVNFGPPPEPSWEPSALVAPQRPPGGVPEVADP